MKAFMERVIALEDEMEATGTFVLRGALHDPDASTVLRAREGDVVMTIGPFVEAKEHIAGLYIINADDLDAALAWARKVLDAIQHPTEVRPFRATERVQGGPVSFAARADATAVERVFRKAYGQAVAA